MERKESIQPELGPQKERPSEVSQDSPLNSVEVLPEVVSPASIETISLSKVPPEPDELKCKEEASDDALNEEWRHNLLSPSPPLTRSVLATDTASTVKSPLLNPPSPDADLYSKGFEGSWKDHFKDDKEVSESTKAKPVDDQPEPLSKSPMSPPPSLIATVEDCQWFQRHSHQNNQMQKWDDDRKIFVPLDNVEIPLPSWNEATSADLGWMFNLNPLEYERWRALSLVQHATEALREKISQILGQLDMSLAQARGKGKGSVKEHERLQEEAKQTRREIWRTANEVLIKNGYARWAPLLYPPLAITPKSLEEKRVHFDSEPPGFPRPPTRRDLYPSVSKPDSKQPEDPEIRRLIEHGTVTKEDFATQEAALASYRNRSTTVTETEVADEDSKYDDDDNNTDFSPGYGPSYFLKDKDTDLAGLESEDEADKSALEEAILASQEQFEEEQAQRTLRLTNPSPEVEMTDVEDSDANEPTPEASGTSSSSGGPSTSLAEALAGPSATTADSSSKMSDRKDSKTDQLLSESNIEGGSDA